MTQIKVSLYIIVPFIWGMVSVLAYILSFQLSNIFYSYESGWIVYNLVGVLLFFVSFIIGYVLLKTVLKPTEDLLIRLKNQDMDSVYSTGLNKSENTVPKKWEPRRGIFMDELGEFQEAFGKIAVGSNINDLQKQFPEIIFKSREMAYVLEQVVKVAPSTASVLILGQSGTGKELIADAIHQKSLRKFFPCIKINCGAISPGLLESELFGHEKGAFTGATSTHKGCFERADKGTLFLDEIGELPSEVQVKLLRVLQNGEFQRVGGQKTFTVDVRIISATNRILEKEVALGTFREDLFYRLNVFNIDLPPLNRRSDDIAPLASHFAGKNGKDISESVMQLLKSCEWKGNIRELENKISKACICSHDRRILAENDFDLKKDMAASRDNLSFSPQPQSADMDTLKFDLTTELNRIEINYIVDALKKNNGVQARAAEFLGITPRSLWNRIKKFEIDVGDFK